MTISLVGVLALYFSRYQSFRTEDEMQRVFARVADKIELLSVDVWMLGISVVEISNKPFLFSFPPKKVEDLGCAIEHHLLLDAFWKQKAMLPCGLWCWVHSLLQSETNFRGPGKLG